ncbi:hypothetical protein QBE53_10975 [Vallitaleaceae bacterium 9-2]
MYDQKIAWPYSWPFIIFTMIVFFPIGIALLIKREMIIKKSNRILIDVMFVVSILLYVFGVSLFSLSISLEGGFAGGFWALIFIVAGFLTHRFSKKLRRQSQSVHVHQNAQSIKETQQNVHQNTQSIKETQRNVQINSKEEQIEWETMTTNFFDDEFMDGILNSALKSVDATKKTPEKRVVVCTSCGANNTITEATGECEYCGSPIA